MNLDLLVPDIGDFENVEIIEVLVKKGDKINKNDPVVTYETKPATSPSIARRPLSFSAFGPYPS